MRYDNFTRGESKLYNGIRPFNMHGSGNILGHWFCGPPDCIDKLPVIWITQSLEFASIIYHWIEYKPHIISMTSHKIPTWNLYIGRIREYSSCLSYLLVREGRIYLPCWFIITAYKFPLLAISFRGPEPCCFWLLFLFL